jgi:hypothetical protein
MISRELLNGRLNNVEGLLDKIAAVTAREDEGRRLQLVQLRRALAGELAIFTEMAEAYFSGTPDHAVYCDKLSRMRTSSAIHRSSWPAVMIDDGKSDFRNSAKPMREANREFIRWMLRALAEH